jgi:hypothetical protein
MSAKRIALIGRFVYYRRDIDDGRDRRTRRIRHSLSGVLSANRSRKLSARLCDVFGLVNPIGFIPWFRRLRGTTDAGSSGED